jgi:hypothetical protein
MIHLINQIKTSSKEQKKIIKDGELVNSSYTIQLPK